MSDGEKINHVYILYYFSIISFGWFTRSQRGKKQEYYRQRQKNQICGADLNTDKHIPIRSQRMRMRHI